MIFQINDKNNGLELSEWAASWVNASKTISTGIIKNIGSAINTVRNKIKGINTEELSTATQTVTTAVQGLNAAVIEEADGQLAFTTAMEASSVATDKNTLSTQGNIDVGNEDKIVTSEQTKAKYALIEAKNKELLATVKQKLIDAGALDTKIGTKLATQDLTIEILQEGKAIDGLVGKISIATLEMLGFKATTEATTKILQAFKIAAGMLVAMLAGQAVELLIKGVKYLVNYWDNLSETVQSTMETFESATKTATEHKNSIDSLKSKYEELSKGVDAFGNNIGLTTSQFDEYNEISNEIADMFPKLVSGYTSEGNAILKCKGNVEALTQAYQEEIKAAAKAVKQERESTVKNYKKNEKSSIYSANDPWTNEAVNLTRPQMVETLTELTSLSSDELLKIANQNSDNSIARTLLLDVYGLNEDNVNDVMKELRDNLDTYKSELEDDLSSIRDTLTAFFQDDNDYFNNSLSEIQKSAIQSIINNLDASVANTLVNDSDYQNYINKLISGIKDNKDSFNDAFNYLLNVDVNTPDNIENTKAQIDSYVDTVVQYTGLKSETVWDMFGLSSFNTLYDQFETAKETIKKFGTDLDIQQIFKDNDIKSSDDIAGFIQIMDDAYEAGEGIDYVIEKYKAWKKTVASNTFAGTDIFQLTTTDDDGNETSTALGKLSDEIDEIQNAYSTLTSAIAEYNTDGSYSIDTLQSILALGDNWLDYLVDENGALQLDEDSLKNLTQARIEDMKQQTIQSMIDNVKSISTEADLNTYLASTNYDLANSYEAVAKAEVEAAKTHLQSLVDSGEITAEQYDQAIQKLENDISKVNQLFNNTDWNIGTDGSSSTALSTLENHASLVRSVQEEYESLGRLSSDTLSSICSAYSEMDVYVTKFRMGLISEEELFEQLTQCYENDKNNYIQATALKMQADEDFCNAVYTEYPELYDEINNVVYAGDLKNFKSLEQAKLDIDEKIRAELASGWEDYLSVVYNSLTGMYEVVVSGDDSEEAVKFDTEEEYQNYIQNNSDAGKSAAYLNQLQALRNKIEEYSTNVASTKLNNIDLSWQNLSSSASDYSDSVSDAADETEEDFDWIERALKKVENEYTRLNDVVGDTTRSWTERNNALVDSMGKLTEQIELQSEAYDTYMQMFWATNLDDYYKQLIIDGAMFVETITDQDLIDLINDAQDLFDKAEDAKNSVSSLTAELHELSTQIFDNTASKFEEMLDVYEHAMTTLENGVSLIETRGYKVVSSLYDAMIDQTQDKIQYLKDEREALEDALNSADVVPGSEAWMDMYNQILDVDNAIQEATISLAEFNNELRQLKWDKFDDIQSGIQETIDEADFLYELMSNQDMYDDDGVLTDIGQASQALLLEKYNLYMAMADKYAQGVKEIDAELVNDPNNVNLLERRQELLKAQRESILSAEDEKQAVLDLAQEAYDTLDDTISDLIDKYKDLMSTIKDTYDYEKEMAEKTAELADLQKQYAAIRNDDSEEGMTRRQQLEASIKESEDDIEQTEYEKLISDTEKLLDEFEADYQDWLTNLVVELETVLENAINETNMYSDQILATLNDQAYSVGYTLSDTTTAVFTGIGDSVAMYGDGFLDVANGISSSVDLVASYVERIYNSIEAQQIAEEAINQSYDMIDTAEEAVAAGETWNDDYSEPAETSSSPGVGSIMTLKDGASYWENSWGNGRSGSYYAGVQGGVVIDSKSIAGEVDGGQNYASAYGDYYVHIKSADGVFQDLGWVRWEDLEAYGKGTRHTNENFAWTQENGGELIRQSDGAVLTPVKGSTVFSSDMTNRLWDFANNPSDFLGSYGNSISSGSTQLVQAGNNVSMDVGGFNITVVANSPTEFAQQLRQTMASDKNAQKMIQEITLGQSLGKNSLNVNMYK